MTDIRLTEGVLTIGLPGLTAIRIDVSHRVIAVDCTSGSGTVGREWTVADLRDGTYGDFHRLGPADSCIDVACIEGGEHMTAQSRTGG